MKAVPEVGKFYHFFDDGKTSPSRHYICKCERVITCEEGKGVMLSIPDHDNGGIRLEALYDYWLHEVLPNHDWLFEQDTDYFIECSCPNYDDDNLWFGRTKDGGWFSMDIQNFWQGGRLDVDGNIYENIINDVKAHPDWYNVEPTIAAYENKKYEK